MLHLLIASALAATLSDDLRTIAKLPGEPSIVSAAGLDANGEPILTLENPSAFDPQSTRKRIVIFAAGGSDQRAAAVLRLVRWMKTSAPPPVRDGWIASALPSAVFTDTASLPRWLEFQNADTAFEGTDDASTTRGLLRVLNPLPKPPPPLPPPSPPHPPT